MLTIKPTYAVDDVVSIKLANGDEIIAKCVAVDDKAITVTRPLLMILSQDPATGRPAISMAPFWMLGAEPTGKYTISHDQIICTLKSNSESMKGYISQTTGLAMPGGSGLIT
jgi:hypothetical protein